MPKMPRPEVEYFGKKDVEKKKKLAETKKSQLAQEELSKLKQIHFRHCAECGLDLDEITFRGLRIHKCFNCGGVFLENGVLEQLCGEESNIIEGLLSLFRFDSQSYEK